VTVTSRKPRETKEVPDGLVINTHGKAWVFIDQEELSTLGAKSRMMNIKRTTHNMMAKLQGLLSVLKMLVVHNPEAAKIKKSFETVRQRLEVNNNIVLENQVSESEVQGDPINKGHEKAMLTMSMSYCMQEFQRELANLCIQITNDAHEHKKLNDTCDYIRLVFDEIRRDLITTRNDADELLTAVEQVGAQKNVHAALPFLNFVTVLPSAPRLLALQAK
jgi:hypothetical protein